MSEKEKDTNRKKPGITMLELSYVIIFVSLILCLLEPLFLTVYPFVVVIAIIFGIVRIFRVKKEEGYRKELSTAIAVVIMATAVGTWMLFGGAEKIIKRVRSIAPRMVCATNLSALGKAMFVYASDHGRYPDPNQWCDLLIEYAEVSDKQFVCYGARERSDEHRCHYAMNPYCDPNSPTELVLLFESKGGWNQFGGYELLTMVDHKGEGCNILFNDGHVAFCSLSALMELKWKDEEGERPGAKRANP